MKAMSQRVGELERSLAQRDAEVAGLRARLAATQVSNRLLRRQLEDAEAEATVVSSQPRHDLTLHPSPAPTHPQARALDPSGGGGASSTGATQTETALLRQRIAILEEHCHARDRRIRALGQRSSNDNAEAQPTAADTDDDPLQRTRKQLEEEVWRLHKRLRLAQAEALAKDVRLTRAERQARVAARVVSHLPLGNGSDSYKATTSATPATAPATTTTMSQPPPTHTYRRQRLAWPSDVRWDMPLTDQLLGGQDAFTTQQQRTRTHDVLAQLPVPYLSGYGTPPAPIPTPAPPTTSTASTPTMPASRHLPRTQSWQHQQITALRSSQQSLVAQPGATVAAAPDLRPAYHSSSGATAVPHHDAHAMGQPLLSHLGGPHSVPPVSVYSFEHASGPLRATTASASRGASTGSGAQYTGWWRTPTSGSGAFTPKLAASLGRS